MKITPQKIGKLILTLALIYTGNSPIAIAATPTPTLEGTIWKLISWTETLPLGDTAITATFAKNRLSGSSGCNRFMGGYQEKNNTLTIDKDLAGTRKACPEEQMKLESKFLTLLPGAKQYMINPKGNLQIVYKTAQGLGLMTFAPQAKAAADKIWLDKPLSNWNKGDGIIPKPATKPSIDDRCVTQIRRATTEEDKAVAKAGWKLFNAVQTYGKTVVVAGMSGVDGMCRPKGYMEFVFVNGKFVGTVAPVPMDSRTDGASQEVFLQNANSLVVAFNRYSPGDPLCCPSRTSRVSYTIDKKTGKLLLTPTAVSTVANKAKT
ncbi:MAG: hypothetical protein N5P05_000251 [Chroococcopsis gigantea SAG 12.99]|jgi:heat shock protein HslJ|nr:META domain-containing protein [Chlorogloea purpurea SAG 13.99]MDV2998645.1 hypothetical protein [Chroococcopsis gigantea SAG 12.99]